MRIVAIAIITGVALFMAWLWFQPDCPGGAIANSETECVDIKGFDRAFCARAFARPEEAIFAAGNFFRLQSECQKQHVVCIEQPRYGWTPKPSGFCLMRGPAGEVQTMKPVYGARRS